MSEAVKVKGSGAVVEIIINRPERRNLLDLEILESLESSLVEVVQARQTHVVVLHGAGPGFCAGVDLDGIVALPEQRRADVLMPAVDVFQRVIDLLAGARCITIAAAHGFALGAGLDLALACDLRIASAGTQFASDWVQHGLIPVGGATWSLPRLIGLGPAMAMLLAGDPMDVEGAYRLGLVHRRTALGRHLTDAMRWAAELTERSQAAQAAIKRLARIDPRLTLSAALKEERESARRILLDPGLSGFLPPGGGQ